MVDIICLCQSYERCQITEVIWIDGGSNSADAMTKIHPCQVLRDLIDSNTINLKAAGWVERAEGEIVIKGTSRLSNHTNNTNYTWQYLAIHGVLSQYKISNYNLYS